MESTQAIQVMNALAQPTRLEVYMHLARSQPDGLASGTIAEILGIPANTMSVHLAILSRAGLVTSARTGRKIIYKVMPDVVEDLTRFLSAD